MGLQSRGAEFWHPHSWAQGTGGESPQQEEACRDTQAGRRDGDAHTLRSKQQDACLPASQGDVYRRITGDPRMVRGPPHGLTRDMTDQRHDRPGKDTHTHTLRPMALPLILVPHLGTATPG